MCFCFALVGFFVCVFLFLDMYRKIFSILSIEFSAFVNLSNVTVFVLNYC